MARMGRLLASLLLFPMLAATAAAQEALDRTPQLAGGWTGIPGALEVHLGQLLQHEPVEGRLMSTSNFLFGFTPARRLLLGTAAAIQSGTVPETSAEWQPFARLLVLDEHRGSPVHGAVSLGFNTAAGSGDAEVSLARWLGPLRVLAAGRAFTDGYDEGSARGAIGGGAVLHPLMRRAPLAVSGDVVTLLDRDPGEQVAWSAGLHFGIAHTTHTLSLFATNGTSGTLQGTSRGTPRTQYGVELTLPMAIGRMFGWYPARELSADVVERFVDTEPAVRVEFDRYQFTPRLVEIRAGQTVEWTNLDHVVHTVNAEDGAWRSGGIDRGERWRATFNRPGQYVVYCGPHPYMRSVVIVR